GAPLVALAREDDKEMASLASETIAIPEINELLSPILTVVPLQLFAYHSALLRGANPDTVRREIPLYQRANAFLSL
ncbi:MAG TPA: hypothetical protein VJO34_02200, partial [Methylomirabilota bacterium]|nr:hypothetical protein [Methylomirabilota bacterium]